MFTPENIKKLTNVSIVSLKTRDHRFELALFPNKFYEYQHNLERDLEKILHTDVIFKDVSKGQIAAKDTIAHEFPKMAHESVVRFILTHGVEKKSEKTRLYELNKKEREIAVVVSKKVLFEGRNLSSERAVDVMKEKGLSVCLRKDAKVQANGMIKVLLEDCRFTVKKIKVELISENRIVEMSGDEFNRFKEESERNNVKFVILQDECINEEEIC